MFAAALVCAFPHLPIEEEGRLNDAHLRENFIERVFAYHRLQSLWATRWTLRSLIAFHTANKMTLLSHDEPGYRRLGRLVAIGKSLARELHDRMRGFMTRRKRLGSGALEADPHAGPSRLVGTTRPLGAARVSRNPRGLSIDRAADAVSPHVRTLR